ncbi:MAG: hypothetical protein AB7S26_06355 [Sandaracinaceae bacterium]
MSSLFALAFATPIFGFALTPPPGTPVPPGAPIANPSGYSLTLGVGEAPEGDALGTTGSLLEVPTFHQSEPDDDADGDDEGDDADEGPSSGGSDLAAQLRQRQDVAAVHRAFGIATWVSMLATSVLGFIQYYNLYGFFSGREDTPCVTGNAVFGQDQCWGTPWPHRIGWITTTALYSATFFMSFIMPDPLNSAATNADLDLHKTLRWFHLAGMVIQVFLGLATANNWFGIDRANNYEAQQALATVHQLVGWTTLGLTTAAGLVLLID